MERESNQHNEAVGKQRIFETTTTKKKNKKKNKKKKGCGQPYSNFVSREKVWVCLKKFELFSLNELLFDVCKKHV